MNGGYHPVPGEEGAGCLDGSYEIAFSRDGTASLENQVRPRLIFEDAIGRDSSRHSVRASIAKREVREWGARQNSSRLNRKERRERRESEQQERGLALAAGPVLQPGKLVHTTTGGGSWLDFPLRSLRSLRLSLFGA
jgi:hypothetical protein